MHAPTFWKQLAALSAFALVATATTFAQDPETELDRPVSQSSDSAAPLGLMAPAVPTIDSIDGTGMRSASVPGTDSIDGTGLEVVGSSDTDSIDGTGFMHSTPADNLAQSGQPLRTIDAEQSAAPDCDDGTAMDDSCDPETATSE